jgi:hypothetical protein
MDYTSVHKTGDCFCLCPVETTYRVYKELKESFEKSPREGLVEMV